MNVQQRVDAPESAGLSLLLNSLVSRLSREMLRDLSRLGIGVQGARVLALLHERGGLRCSTLANTVGLEATALSHLLRVLAEQDLVSRERVKSDNRSVEVRLTEKGRAVAQLCRDIDADKERQLLAGLGPDDVAHLEGLLSRMSANLEPRRAR